MLPDFGVVLVTLLLLVFCVFSFSFCMLFVVSVSVFFASSLSLDFRVLDIAKVMVTLDFTGTWYRWQNLFELSKNVFSIFPETKVVFAVHFYSFCNFDSWQAKKMYLWKQLLKLLFSSPDPKGHVSYCHHWSSVVRRPSVRPLTFHILINSSESTGPIWTKLWWNGPWMAPFQICVRWSRFPTKMAAKLKIEKRGDEILIVHCCFSISQNELKF